MRKQESFAALIVFALTGLAAAPAAAQWCFECQPQPNHEYYCVFVQEPGWSYCNDGGASGYCMVSGPCGGSEPDMGVLAQDELSELYASAYTEIRPGHLVMTNCSGRIISRDISIAAADDYMRQSQVIDLKPSPGLVISD